MGNIYIFLPMAGKIMGKYFHSFKSWEEHGEHRIFFSQGWENHGGKFPYFSKFGNKLDKRSQHFPNVETHKKAQFFPRKVPYL